MSTYHDSLVPDGLSAPLLAVATRQRQFRILSAAFKAIGVAAAICLIAVLILGSSPNLPVSLRWLVAATAWAAMTLMAWRILRGSFAPMNLLSAAAVVESRQQAHEEKLRSAVEFSSDDKARHLASGELIDRVIDDARIAASKIDIREVVSGERLIKAAAICVPALLAWTLLWPLIPGTVDLGVRRTLMPWSAQMPLSAMNLKVTPGNIKLGQGSTLMVIARDQARTIAKKPLHLKLAAKFADGRGIVDAMTATGPRSYRHTFAKVQESFHYRIMSGRGESRWYTVQVIQRPAITGITIRYTYPPYTHLPMHTVSGVDGTISGLRGTQIRLTVDSTQPLGPASALQFAAMPGMPSFAAPLHRRNGTTYQAGFVLENTTHYRIDLYNHEHVSNDDNRPWPVLVQADPLPTVHVISPRGVIKALPDDIIPIHYEAQDTYGITAVRVRIKIAGAPSMSYPIAIGTLNNRQYAGVWHFNVADQLLAANEPHARRLLYRLIVVDNCEPAHQTGVSGEHEIQIDPNLSMSYQGRRDAILYKRFSHSVKRSLQKLTQARNQIASLQRVPASQRFNPWDMKQANHSQNLIASSAQQLKSAAAKMTHGSYRRLASRVSAVANKPLQRAANQLALAAFANPRLTQKRSQQLAAAHQAVSQAIHKIKSIEQHLNATAKNQELTDNVSALAQQQANVSKALAINPTDRQAIRQQRQIENRLQNLVRQHKVLQAPTRQAAAPAVGDLENQLAQIMRAQKSIKRALNARLNKQKALDQLAKLQRQQAQLGQQITQFTNAHKGDLAASHATRVSHTAMQTAVRALGNHHAAAAGVAQRQIASQLQRAGGQLIRRAAQGKSDAARQATAAAAAARAAALAAQIARAGRGAGPKPATKKRMEQLARQVQKQAQKQQAAAGTAAAQQLNQQAMEQAQAALNAAADGNSRAMAKSLQAAGQALAGAANKNLQSAAQQINPQTLSADAQTLSAYARRQSQLAHESEAIAHQLRTAREPSSQSIARSAQVAAAIARAEAQSKKLEQQTALGSPALAAAIAQAGRQMHRARADQFSTNRTLLHHNHAEADIRQQAALSHIQLALGDLHQAMRGNGTGGPRRYNHQIAGQINPNQQPPAQPQTGQSQGAGKGAPTAGQVGQNEYQRLMQAASQVQQALAASHNAAQGHSGAAQAAANSLSQAAQALAGLNGGQGQPGQGQPGQGQPGQSMPGGSQGGQPGAAGAAPAQGGAMGVASAQPGSGAAGTGISADLRPTGQMPKTVSALGISPAQWVNLGPLEQKQLLSTARQSIPPGYRQLVRDYYVRISRLNRRQSPEDGAAP